MSMYRAPSAENLLPRTMMWLFALTAARPITAAATWRRGTVPDRISMPTVPCGRPPPGGRPEGKHHLPPVRSSESSRGKILCHLWNPAGWKLPESPGRTAWRQYTESRRSRRRIPGQRLPEPVPAGRTSAHYDPPGRSTMTTTSTASLPRRSPSTSGQTIAVI